jgi:hypothetical protein
MRLIIKAESKIIVDTRYHSFDVGPYIERCLLVCGSKAQQKHAEQYPYSGQELSPDADTHEVDISKGFVWHVISVDC